MSANAVRHFLDLTDIPKPVLAAEIALAASTFGLLGKLHRMRPETAVAETSTVQA